MLFFHRRDKATQSEEQLSSLYKSKLGWNNWYLRLNEKASLVKDRQQSPSLWFNLAGLVGERLSSLTDTYNQLSSAQAQPLIKLQLDEALQHAQGDSKQLIEQWTTQVLQLKRACAQLEEELGHNVSTIGLTLGGLAHCIVSQPGYTFASTCFNELALAARNDPQLAPYLTLDDVYLGFFKHMSGCLLFTLEVGLYFYFNLTSVVTLMWVHAFFAHDKVRESIYHASEKYLPGYEYSILSGLRGSVSLLSTLFFFALQCNSDDSLRESLMKWGSLAVVGLALERVSAKVSTQLSNVLGHEHPHQAFMAQTIVHYTLLLCAWLYMYPWLVQNIEASLGMQDVSPSQALKTLGLEEQATAEEIKKQVRSLVRQYHPDHNSAPIAKEMTQKILAAAETLKEAQRGIYNQP